MLIEIISFVGSFVFIIGVSYFFWKKRSELQYYFQANRNKLVAKIIFCVLCGGIDPICLCELCCRENLAKNPQVIILCEQETPVSSVAREEVKDEVMSVFEDSIMNTFEEML